MNWARDQRDIFKIKKKSYIDSDWEPLKIAIQDSNEIKKKVELTTKVASIMKELENNDPFSLEFSFRDKLKLEKEELDK